MHKKLIRRTLLMATVVVGMVAASALPASAVNTPLTFVTFGGNPGTVSIGAFSVNIPSAGAGACDAAGTASSLSPDIDGSGNVTLATTDYEHTVGGVPAAGLAPGTFTSGSNNYQVQILGDDATAGTIDTSTDTATINVDVRAVFKNCNGVGTLCTVDDITATLVGNYTNNTLPPPSGAVADNLSGTSNTLVLADFSIGCNSVIRSALVGNAANITLHAQA